MADLVDLKCVPCRGNVPPLSQEDIYRLMPQVPGWELEMVSSIPRLVRRYKVRNFQEALTLTNRIGVIAEAEDHHPAILVEYRQVTVSWWTHAANGLHQNDFIMAAKTDRLYTS